MSLVRLHRTVGVRVGKVQVGGGAPVVVQSMTMTDTADAAATARQCIELAEAGSEMVRVTVNLPEAAAAVPTELLEMCNLVGPESYVKERIEAFRESGVTHLNVIPATEDPVATTAQLKEWIS